MKSFVFFALLLIAYVYGDCYMQNPRGSNGRLYRTDDNANRQNGNRLMDTQNNAKGGYCVGPPLSFYEGSQLTIEWTTQHGCGNPKLNCNVVIQYMCSRTVDAAGTPLPGEMVIRDGAVTDTIPFNAGQSLAENIADAHVAPDANDSVEARVFGAGNTPPANDPRRSEDLETGGFRFGMHENVEYYTGCRTRTRNLGLFVAERVINGNLPDGGGPATRTRQNNNGNRNGLECPEERDYYPYWHPSPWKDIGVVTDNRDNCDFFRSQSQNVRSKNFCRTADSTDEQPAPSQYNNEAECTVNGDVWIRVDSHGLPPPECVSAPFNRDNHLGNGITGFANTFNWTLPTSSDEDCINDNDCNCVLRIRYNISGGEFTGWGSNAVDVTDSGLLSPVVNDPYINLDNGAYVRLAIDTTQFGRTFQDRSHVFHLISRNSGDENRRIYNLNVRGKRGNIVQAYPATEYDFVPTFLSVRNDDMIHFQWTGCDFNPNGNAGEGVNRSDRSNIVQMADNNLATNLPRGPGSEENGLLTFSSSGPSLFSDSTAFRMATIGQDITNPAVCINNEEALDAAASAEGNNDETQDRRNCALLNGAPTPYYDAGLVTVNTESTGVSTNYNYMSTRNNNFTNRGQKAQIQVGPLIPVWAIVLIAVSGVACLGSLGAAITIAVLKIKDAGENPITKLNNFI